jgi:hypothetical protein
VAGYIDIEKRYLGLQENSLGNLQKEFDDNIINDKTV